MPQNQAEAIAKAQNKALQEIVSTQQFSTKENIYEVKAEIVAVKHELIKWFVGAMLAQSALLVAIMAFMK